MHMTMIDKKVCKSATGNLFTMPCYICKLTIKDFNNLGKVFNSTPCFRLATLHAWIRFYECFLHLSRKLTIKKWQGEMKK